MKKIVIDEQVTFTSVEVTSNCQWSLNESVPIITSHGHVSTLGQLAEFATNILTQFDSEECSFVCWEENYISVAVMGG